MAGNPESTILIVDDEPDLCEMLAFEFSSRGYQSFFVLDGRQAIEASQTRSIQVIVSDLRMPYIDGLELVERFKSVDVRKPVMILMSAYADLSHEEAHDRGAEALFTKPFRLADLAQKVQQLLLPVNERWRVRQGALPSHSILRRVPGLDAGRRDRNFDLGRGGMALLTESARFASGQRVAFTVDFDSGPITRLSGTGLVRWVDGEERSSEPRGCGIEFEYLDDATRAPFVQWMESQPLKPYIPALLG